MIDATAPPFPGTRLLRILRTFRRNRIDLVLNEAASAIISDARIRRRLRYLMKPLAWGEVKESGAVRLRQAFESLGPVFIKFAQALSTRRDLLPDEYANELAKLQDKVPPFDGKVALNLIERSLGEPLSAVFASIDTKPMASASLAQVHGAQLLDGRAVVVKVIRPDVEPIIEADLSVLRWLAHKLDTLSPELRRLRLREVIADYEQVIRGELDLLQEADNTAELKRNFAHSSLLYVPEVHRHLSSSKVLVLEHLHGIPVGDLARLRAAGVDFPRLAERGVEIFFTQVFIDNYFHADMHPGNILVDVSDPAAPSYQAIDCAIMGSLSAEDQDYLARNLMAFFRRDYAEVVRLHINSGWVPAATDARAFERVIRSVCEPIFAKPLKDISFGGFLLTLFETARRFDMRVQPQLVLLQKTLLAVEGLGRQLHPDLDLWQTAGPFMERWMAERAGLLGTLRFLRQETPRLIDAVPRLLRDHEALLTNLKSNSDQHQLTHLTLQGLLAESARRRRWDRWLGGAMVVVALGFFAFGRAEMALLLSAGTGVWLLARA